MNLSVVIPTATTTRRTPSGTNRTGGISKLQLHEMGSRYLFIVLYVFLESHLSRGDYRRPDAAPPPRPPHLLAGTPAMHGRVSRRMHRRLARR